MCAARREMHLGVFVLGAGNHSAGWRYEGAATETEARDTLSRLQSWLTDFVDQIVPELQARGPFRRAYAGTTPRDHLGLPRVPVPRR
jgi:hypothetical protein